MINTDLLFNFIEGWFEPPTEDELLDALVLKTEQPDS
jgi:hypothetical protein